MHPPSALALLALCASFAAGPLSAQGFSFSRDAAQQEAQQQADEAAKHQENYGPHFRAINNRLRMLGLTTYTPEEIRRQIAQAEIDAYFRNDPDAALSAARRLGASFILRGLITAQATFNPLVRVNQVSINMDFTLTGANGRIVSAT